MATSLGNWCHEIMKPLVVPESCKQNTFCPLVVTVSRYMLHIFRELKYSTTNQTF